MSSAAAATSDGSVPRLSFATTYAPPRALVGADGLAVREDDDREQRPRSRRDRQDEVSRGERDRRRARRAPPPSRTRPTTAGRWRRPAARSACGGASPRARRTRAAGPTTARLTRSRSGARAHSAATRTRQGAWRSTYSGAAPEPLAAVHRDDDRVGVGRARASSTIACPAARVRTTRARTSTAYAEPIARARASVVSRARLRLRGAGSRGAVPAAPRAATTATTRRRRVRAGTPRRRSARRVARVER